LDAFAQQTDFVQAAGYYPNFKYGECYREHEVGVQCELVNLSADVDPNILPYDQKMRYYLKEFCLSTSAHGIPLIGQAQNAFSRTFWTLLYIFSFTVFAFQGKSIIDKYQLNEKIVDIQLVFDAAPFPAITLCNLNPYKKSAAAKVSLVSRTLKAFDDVMNKAAGASAANSAANSAAHASGGGLVAGGAGGGDGHHLRHRRSDGVMFEPARSSCSCDGDTHQSCEVKAVKEKKPAAGERYCMCAFDRLAGDAYPCYPHDLWTEPLMCLSCDHEGYCSREKKAELGHKSAQCVCTSVNDFCSDREYSKMS
jgi:hypothetical protein